MASTVLSGCVVSNTSHIQNTVNTEPDILERNIKNIINHQRIAALSGAFTLLNRASV